MKTEDAWWPPGLTDATSSGSQNDWKYAFFPAQRRLVISQHGAVQQYDTGDHQISGMQQSQGGSPSFSTADGEVALSSLRKVG